MQLFLLGLSSRSFYQISLRYSSQAKQSSNYFAILNIYSPDLKNYSRSWFQKICNAHVPVNVRQATSTILIINFFKSDFDCALIWVLLNIQLQFIETVSVRYPNYDLVLLFGI